VLDDVVGFLVCPLCEADLGLEDGVVRCTNRHAFDVARQGYVNLQPGGGHRGDDAAMVAARADFLAAGHYAPIVEAVAATAAAEAAVDPGGVADDRVAPGHLATAAAPRDGGRAGCVVDVGAGTGYWLAAVLERLPGRVGLALDVSRYALRRAARAHRRIGAVGCDTWRALPVRSGVADLVLDVFAPRNGPEIARVLRPGGRLLVVTPTPRHLGELVTALGLVTVDERKRERLDDALRPWLSPAGRERHEFGMALDHTDVTALAAMGPSARHVDPATLAARVAALSQPFTVTASVELAILTRF
jgi:23S rRNA (guanine745-N1)-methyltransferase